MNEFQTLQQIRALISTTLSTNTEKQITLKNYIEKCYMPFQKSAKKEANYKHIVGQLKIINNYDFTDKIIGDISENDIINFFNLLKKDRNISQATQNRYRSLLNHIFNFAIKDKILFYNPVKYIPRYREVNRTRVLENYEMDAFLNACKESPNKELYYIVIVALYTGMRYSNVINMKKSKIKGNAYFLGENETKSGKSQIIYLHQDLLNELNTFIKEYNIVGDCIFKTNRIKRSFKTALTKANIENFRFHDLRRTFATALLNNHTDIKTIQHILGHSSILMTEKYLANDSKKEIDAINKLCFIYITNKKNKKT